MKPRLLTHRGTHLALCEQPWTPGALISDDPMGQGGWGGHGHEGEAWPEHGVTEAALRGLKPAAGLAQAQTWAAAIDLSQRGICAALRSILSASWQYLGF